MKCACVKEKGVNRGFHFVSDKLGPTSKMVHALKRGHALKMGVNSDFYYF